jgi:prepilin-type N-terminal cleavage/methylation domain-containing protein
MRNTKYESGFTLAELLMAMIVTGIILGAVATLAYALGAANDAADDATYKQAQVRYATLRISEMIRHCRLVFDETSEGLGVWRADDNEDGQVNADEVVYVSKGPGGDCLQFIEFVDESNPAYTNFGTIIQALVSSGFSREYTILIPECSNVRFVTDVSPPQSRAVSIFFDLEESGVTHTYQIETTLRAWAGHLLNLPDYLVSGDDDEGPGS